MPSPRSIVLSLLLTLAATSLPAAPLQRRSASLLPAATKAYVSVTRNEQLQDRWRETKLSELLDAPELQPFRAQAQRRMDERREQMERQYGLTLEELLAISAGEAALGVIETADEQVTLALLDEVGDDLSAAQDLVRSAGDRLKKRGAAKTEITIAGTQVALYKLPDEDGGERDVVMFIKEGVLAVIGDVATATTMLQQWSVASEGKLASLPAYRDVMQRLAAADPDRDPPLVFFADPLRLDELLDPPELQADGRRRPTFAAKHGFDALRAVGGVASVAEDGLDVLYRLAVYAPRPYAKGMLMLDFPAGGELTPPAWAPDYLSSLVVMNWRVERIIEHIGPLFDDVAANDQDGSFDEIYQDVKTELDVDLRELFARLGPRVVIGSDFLPQVSGSSQRDFVAVEIKPGQEANVEEEIARLLRDDPTVQRIALKVPYAAGERIVVKDHALWRVGESGGLGGQEGRKGFTAAGVMTAHGYLFIATNYDLLRRLFTPAAQVGGPKFADAADFRQAVQLLNSLHDGDACARMFSRLERDFFTTYELLRQGRVEEAETMYGRGITMLLERLDEEETLDFSALPEFRAIAGFLGVSAASIQPQENGWLITGFLKPK